MSTYTLPRPRRATGRAREDRLPGREWRPAGSRRTWPAGPPSPRWRPDVTAAFRDLGWAGRPRANDVDPGTGHGFISSQRMGLEVFKSIPVDAPLIVAEAVWQYSHHVLAGLRTHRGPILTVANFAGEWPGLVGAARTQCRPHEDGRRVLEHLVGRLHRRLVQERHQASGSRRAVSCTTHPTSVRCPSCLASPEADLGRALGDQLLADKAIIGVFDEGCMGMYNAIFDDELLNPLGIYKERLSQSALYAEMLTIDDAEADAVRDWLIERGMTFRFGTDDATELTQEQVRWQLKMYIAALRIADDFGLDAVGIQYQQGLKTSCPRPIWPREC